MEKNAGNDCYLISKDKEKCCGCGACVSVCRVGALKMQADAEGFLYPSLSEDQCINCGQCVVHCSFSKPQPQHLQRGPQVYALKHKSEKVRHCSSSGGAFTAISDVVLADGGVICGAKLVSNHIR